MGSINIIEEGHVLCMQANILSLCMFSAARGVLPLWHIDSIIELLIGSKP